MESNLNTLVIGAHTSPDRYAFKAITRLRKHNFAVIAFGKVKGSVLDVEIENTWNENWDVDTVTLYINPLIQESYYDAIIALKPRRVIFNPGTENATFQQLLSKNGIEFENACTLVLLATDSY